MRILSICTSAGIWDRAFIEAGHDVVPGCEIEAHKRAMYCEFTGAREGDFLCHDLADLPAIVEGEHFDLVTGGPSCQSHSKLRAMRPDAKFPDLTPLVDNLLAVLPGTPFLF